jgi:hypothetical protein
MRSFFLSFPGPCCAAFVALNAALLLSFVTGLQAQDSALLKACKAKGNSPDQCALRLYGR